MGERHVYKCGRCAEPLAFEGRPPYGDLMPDCPFCGGRLRYMGQVTDDARRAHVEERSVCDDRCTHAHGPACHCKCQGANHASGLVVRVVVVDGRAEAIAEPDKKRDARVAKALEDLERFDRDAKDLRRDITAAYPEIDRRRTGYLRGEAYRRYQEGIEILKGINAARNMKSPKGRLDALARIRKTYGITPAPKPAADETSPVQTGTLYPVSTQSTQEGSDMASTATSLTGKIMEARFPGRCTACNGGIRAGETISYRKGDVRHARCAQGAATLAPVPTPTTTYETPAPAPATTFVPTEEQVRALELFAQGGHLAIEAGAGTGKTSTLRLIAESAPTKSFRYVAFNKSIVVDSASKFPVNVAVSTIHSLAWGTMRERYGKRMGGARMGRNQIAAYLNLNPVEFDLGEGVKKILAPAKLAGAVMKAISNFCNSADREPGTQHFEYQDGIDATEGGKRSYRNNDRLRAHLAPALAKAWKDLQKDDADGSGVLPFGHSHYLKLWELSGPRIPVDVILFDEAQDAFPVLVSIVEQQAGHAQLVFVGDSNQTIYTWLGCENALQKVPADNRTYLTHSFRFGTAIAEAANAILGQLDTPMRLTGRGPAGVVDMVEKPRCILTRTNAVAVQEVFRYIDSGQHPHLVGNAKEIIKFALGAEELKTTGHTGHPDLAWASSWAEVQEYAADGSDLAQMVKLVDDHGTERIVSALEGMPTEDRADVVISTAHKSKGREWDTVRLAGDFPAEPEGDESWRLLYVAATRAKRGLDITACPAIRELLGGSAPQGAPDPKARHLHAVA